MKKKAKPSDFIEWEYKGTRIKLFGTVRKVLDNSVIVDITGTDHTTVVSHNCYRIIEEAEVDEAVPQFTGSHIRVGSHKWF